MPRLVKLLLLLHGALLTALPPGRDGFPCSRHRDKLVLANGGAPDIWRCPDMKTFAHICVLLQLCSVCNQRPPPEADSDPRQLGGVESPPPLLDGVTIIEGGDEDAPRPASLPTDRTFDSWDKQRRQEYFTNVTYESFSSYRHDPALVRPTEDDFRLRFADPFPEVLVSVLASMAPDHDFDFGGMSDCGLVDDNQLIAACEYTNWEEVLPGEFPDTLKYLRLKKTGIERLTGAGFETKDILVLEIADHDNLGIGDNAFLNLSSSLQQLFLHQVRELDRYRIRIVPRLLWRNKLS